MSTFKLATWNVNSIRIRLELLKKLIEAENPDIICLQEVKAKEEDFPFADIRAMGYPEIALYGMAGYNGVAILAKTPLKSPEKLNWVGKTDARHIKAYVFDDIEINNIYIPAGGDIPDPIVNLSFAHKLTFMDDIAEYYELHKAELASKKMLLCGDFNVAPCENDVWNHKQMLKIVSPDCATLWIWLMWCANFIRSPKKSIPGGVIVTPIGRPTTKDGDWTMYGFRPT